MKSARRHGERALKVSPGFKREITGKLLGCELSLSGAGQEAGRQAIQRLCDGGKGWGWGGGAKEL